MSDVEVAMNADIGTLHDSLVPFDTLDIPCSYWIRDSDGNDATGGFDYCMECGEDYVFRLNLYAPGCVTHELICSDSSGNYDSVPHCADCGKTLAGWLTDYGESQELAYFEEDGPQPNREDIHVIVMVLWNLQWNPNADYVSRWRAIGEKLLTVLGTPNDR